VRPTALSEDAARAGRPTDPPRTRLQLTSRCTAGTAANPPAAYGSATAAPAAALSPPGSSG